MMRRLWLLVVCHKTFFAFVALALGLLWALYEIESQSRTNHEVLCALMADVERRRDDSQAYLEAHPRGVVSPVTNAVIITPAELQRSIDSQSSTIAALHRGGLHC